MKKKDILSKTNQKDWEEYIKNPKDIFDKDRQDEKSSNKERYKFDFHGFNLEEANKKVKEIIKLCFEKRYKEILIVTGKGIHSKTEQNVFESEDLSKLRHSIPDYIKSTPELSGLVHSVVSADKKDGGEGALIIKLKKL
ncbi:MAG: hypothetical protein CNC06_00555 [Pelagibacterales bacterium MED-G40]|nr:MAG: hypothetical protein CBD63_00875 [Candidatus Pelagibacter sp. TMED203]PDH20278.1 MAG: hypothetical protein CNC06_00555 [Pelagibacterales bacterium MED-G40]